MTAWKENVKGEIEVTFTAGDLELPSIKKTKDILSEVLKYSSFKLIMNGVHDFDSSGLQLLIYFMEKIKSQGGKIEFDRIPSELVSLSASYGIADMGAVEKVNNLSANVGGRNV